MVITSPELLGTGLLPQLRGFLLLLALPLLSRAADTPRGDRALLELVAKENQANRSSLRTWRGKVQVESSTRGLPHKQSNSTTKSTISFAWEGASSRYIFLSDQAWQDPEARPANAPPTIYWGAIRTTEGYFRIRPWKGERTPGGRKAVTSVFDRPSLVIGPRASESRGEFSPDFDPFLYMEVLGDVADRWLMVLHDNWDVRGFDTTRVSRVGEIVTISIDQPGVLKQRFTFDLEKGGSLVSLSAQDDLVRSERTCEYDKVGGVWVPSFCKASRSYSDVVLERDIKWAENLVNQPLPPGSFSLKRLGLEKGDPVSDRRSGTHSDFVEADDSDEPKPPNWALLLVGGGVATCALLLCGVWLLQRYWPVKRAEDANHA